MRDGRIARSWRVQNFSHHDLNYEPPTVETGSIILLKQVFKVTNQCNIHTEAQVKKTKNTQGHIHLHLIKHIQRNICPRGHRVTDDVLSPGLLI